MLVKIRLIEFPNRWPYAVPVRSFTTDDRQPIILSAEADEPRMWRVFDPGSERYVSWGVVEDFSHHTAEQADLRETWVQFDYSIFSSRNRPDDERLRKLRGLLRDKGLGAIRFTPDLRPDEFHIGSMEDPFHTLRLEGDILRQPMNALYVSEPLDIGTINEHTIPDEVEFAWVDLQVTTYGRLETIPTYRELLGRLKKYARLFGKYLK